MRPRRSPAVMVVLALVATIMIGSAERASAAPARSLTFATWNVCKIACGAPAPSWSVRRERVQRVIAGSAADVIALTEATDWTFRSRTQWQDIQRFTRSSGYASPRIDVDRCKRLGCTHTARLLIKSSTVRQRDFAGRPSAGYLRVGDIAPGVPTDFDRQVAWAYLEGADTGPFLAVSVHLSSYKTARAEEHRVAFGHAVNAWADAMNATRGMTGVPVILMGDLNSIETRQPDGVQRVLTDTGWTDAITAPDRVNADINSINYTPAQTSGWPDRPIYNTRRLASRIDYIMMRGMLEPLTYEVVTHTTPDGAFDENYQGSDHLMVRARLQFNG